MLRHPDLRARSRALLEQFLPAIRAVLAGQPATLTAADLASIDSLLGAVAANARPALRAEINTIRRELRQGTILTDLGIPTR